MSRRFWQMLSAILIVMALIPAAAFSVSSLHAAGSTTNALQGASSDPHMMPPSFPRAGTTTTCPAAPAHCDLMWGNGQGHGLVQEQPIAYVIFWGKEWQDAQGNLVPEGQMALNYLHKVGGTSYANISANIMTRTSTSPGTWPLGRG